MPTHAPLSSPAHPPDHAPQPNPAPQPEPTPQAGATRRKTLFRFANDEEFLDANGDLDPQAIEAW